MKNLTLTNLFGELSNEIANKLHLLQKQTDNNEPANVKCKVKSYVSCMTYIIYIENPGMRCIGPKVVIFGTLHNIEAS